MQRLIAIKPTSIVIGLALLLSACGFQLRGSVPISADKQHVYLTATQAHSALQTVLAQAFSDNGVTLTNQAPYTLKLEQTTFDRDSSVISTSGVVSVYTVRLEVSYTISEPRSQTTRTFTEVLERNYSYDANAAAANEEQEATIKQELLQASANRIIRRFVNF